MKFAHEYKAALVREGFPTTWVDSAISYSQLKKALKKVSKELQEIGLDPATLSQFDPNPNRVIQQGSRESGDGAVAYRYEFEGDRKEFRPKLTLFLGDELSVNATLSPDTRAFLERLAAKQGDSLLHEDVSDQQETGDDDCRSSARKTSTESASAVRRVDIPLTSDAEFFDLLKGNVTNLDSLQVLEQESMTDKIVELSTDLTSLAQPRSRFYKKTDMYRWRELFDIYLQAQVFFSTRESDSGSRNSTQAAIQLNWFQSEVKRRGLVELFKLPASHQALDRFVRINIELLLNLKYQELQRTAIGKITKKFQKRTKLAAMKTFPKVIERDMIMSETMTKAVCAQVGNELIKLVPQLDDFRCPICDDIAFRPIRMRCQHIFCILCVVKLQRSNNGRCPICRDSVIMLADTDNIDRDLQTFLKRHFPKETLQKMIDIETFYGKEQFGEQYRHPSEQKCSIM